MNQQHNLCLLINKPDDEGELTIFIKLYEDKYETRVNDKVFGFPLHNIKEGELFNLTTIYEKNSIQHLVTPGTDKDYLWVDTPKITKMLKDMAMFASLDVQAKWIKTITDNLISKGISIRRNNNIDELLK